MLKRIDLQLGFRTDPKLEGVGTFYYTINADKGIAKPEEVTAKQIKGIRVRFIPETSRTQSNKVATRSLVSDSIYWEEWKDENVKKKKEEKEKQTGGGGPVAGQE